MLFSLQKQFSPVFLSSEATPATGGSGERIPESIPEFYSLSKRVKFVCQFGVSASLQS